MTINAILLNLDEILFDTPSLHLAACRAAMADAGVPLRWSMPELKQVASTVGWSRVLDVALPEEAQSGKRVRSIDLNAARHRHFHDALAVRKPDVNPRGMQLISDALEAGCKLAVISDLPAATCAALLHHTFGNEVNSKFSVVASRHDSAHEDDHRAPHAMALRAMGVEPYETVMIDTAEPHLAAARKAGLRTVKFKTPYILSWKALPSMAVHPD